MDGGPAASRAHGQRRRERGQQGEQTQTRGTGHTTHAHSLTLTRALSPTLPPPPPHLQRRVEHVEQRHHRRCLLPRHMRRSDAVPHVRRLVRPGQRALQHVWRRPGPGLRLQRVQLRRRHRAHPERNRHGGWVCCDACGASGCAVAVVSPRPAWVEPQLRTAGTANPETGPSEVQGPDLPTPSPPTPRPKPLDPNPSTQAPRTQPQDGSCDGQCMFSANGCYCDVLCVEYGDCCSDFQGGEDASRCRARTTTCALCSSGGQRTTSTARMATSA